MKQVNVAVTVSDGMVYHLAIVSEGRFPGVPAGPGWMRAGSLWQREVTNEVIFAEIMRYVPQWSGPGRLDPVEALSYRVLNDEEHAMFERDREYRNAIVDVDSVLSHDIDKARECHREKLRAERAAELPQLDALWMRATGQKDQAAADSVELQRQQWRDAPADPRIDAATTIEELKTITVGESK